MALSLAVPSTHALEMVLGTKPQLPHEAEARMEAIRSDRTHGATWLAREALQTLKISAVASGAESRSEFLTETEFIANKIASSRPMFAAIKNVTGLFLFRLIEASKRIMTADDLKASAAKIALELLDEMRAARLKIAERMVEVIGANSVILTHSYSSTVYECLMHVQRSVKLRQLIVTESRPLAEGRRLAKDLTSAEIDVLLVADAAAGYYTKNVDLVLVGADAVRADGSVVNKVGTFALAASAKVWGKPFYVVAETYKLDVVGLQLGEPALEEGPPSDLVLDDLGNAKAANPYFDLTPGSLITSYFTERGPLSPSGVTEAVQSLPNVIHLR